MRESKWASRTIAPTSPRQHSPSFFPLISLGDTDEKEAADDDGEEVEEVEAVGNVVNGRSSLAAFPSHFAA